MRIAINQNVRQIRESWQNHSVEYIDNQISENKLEFVVINDPELDGLLKSTHKEIL